MASQSTTVAALRRLGAGGNKRAAPAAAATAKRGLAAFAPGHYERAGKEFGPGGRSSVSGITAALFGGTGFMGKYLQFEMGAFVFGVVVGGGWGRAGDGVRHVCTWCVYVGHQFD